MSVYPSLDEFKNESYNDQFMIGRIREYKQTLVTWRNKCRDVAEKKKKTMKRLNNVDNFLQVGGFLLTSGGLAVSSSGIAVIIGGPIAGVGTLFGLGSVVSKRFIVRKRKRLKLQLEKLNFVERENLRFDVLLKKCLTDGDISGEEFEALKDIYLNVSKKVNNEVDDARVNMGELKNEVSRFLGK